MLLPYKGPCHCWPTRVCCHNSHETDYLGPLRTGQESEHNKPWQTHDVRWNFRNIRTCLNRMKTGKWQKRRQQLWFPLRGRTKRTAGVVSSTNMHFEKQRTPNPSYILLIPGSVPLDLKSGVLRLVAIPTLPLSHSFIHLHTPHSLFLSFPLSLFPPSSHKRSTILDPCWQPNPVISPDTLLDAENKENPDLRKSFEKNSRKKTASVMQNERIREALQAGENLPLWRK